MKEGRYYQAKGLKMLVGMLVSLVGVVTGMGGIKAVAMGNLLGGVGAGAMGALIASGGIRMVLDRGYSIDGSTQIEEGHVLRGRIRSFVRLALGMTLVAGALGTYALLSRASETALEFAGQIALALCSAGMGFLFWKNSDPEWKKE